MFPFLDPRFCSTNGLLWQNIGTETIPALDYAPWEWRGGPWLAERPSRRRIRSLRTHRHDQRFPKTQRDTKQSTHDMLREHRFHFALHQNFVKHRFHLWAGGLGAGGWGLGPGLGAWLSASSLLPATSLRWLAPPARALRQPAPPAAQPPQARTPACQ